MLEVLPAGSRNATLLKWGSAFDVAPGGDGSAQAEWSSKIGYFYITKIPEARFEAKGDEQDFKEGSVDASVDGI